MTKWKTAVSLGSYSLIFFGKCDDDDWLCDEDAIECKELKDLLGWASIPLLVRLSSSPCVCHHWNYVIRLFFLGSTYHFLPSEVHLHSLFRSLSLYYAYQNKPLFRRGQESLFLVGIRICRLSDRIDFHQLSWFPIISIHWIAPRIFPIVIKPIGISPPFEPCHY